MYTHSPLVSIGMPVYNGEGTLRRAIGSLLAQSFSDFELVISDNCSTDATANICKEFIVRDSRIRYNRQPENIGAAANFKFVFEQARGKYYMWAAGDDIRSPDFLEENVNFLQANQDYVASACPNCFEGQDPTGDNLISFELVGTVEERFRSFFANCWISHGIFYSVIRTDVLRDCKVIGQSFTGLDWAINIFLVSRGKIHRTAKGLTIFGIDGVSSRTGSWGAFRNQRIEWLLPFIRLSRYALQISRSFPLSTKIKIFSLLMKLNLKASFDQSYSELYQFYCAHLRHWVKRINIRS